MDFEKDLDNLDDNALYSISELGQSVKSNQFEIDLLEKALKKKKEEQKKLTEEVFPARLQELGVKAFVLEDGSSVTLEPFIYASISMAKKNEAFEKLREWGEDDVIKNDVSVRFGRGDGEQCEKLKQLLLSQGFVYNQSFKVEPQTLKALLKRRLEKGFDISEELFSVYSGQKVKLKK